MENYTKQGYLNSDFKLFHIIDEKQKEFDYHYHDFDKLLIFIRGRVSYTIEGRTYPLQPYDIVFIRHNEIHRPVIHSNEPYERVIVYISPGFLRDYKANDTNLGYCFEKAALEHTSVLHIPSLQKHPLFKSIQKLEQAFHDENFAYELYRQLLFLEFMIHLNRAVLNDSLDFMHNETSNSRIMEIVKYINIHLTDELNIDQLSDRFYISKYHMMRSFKEETGYSVGNYITQKRLTLAKELILGGTPITEVCYSCGFKDYSNFSRQYKRFFHESPKETKLMSFCSVN